jgi:HAD superfamily hydrolase (TIGR01450 family)
MDGVLYHGERLLPGVKEFIGAIGAIPHLFVTNNPILPPEAVADKLAGFGLPRPAKEKIITSAQAAALYLSEQKPGFRFYAVGADGLHQALRQVGTEDREAADFVVVGEGPGLDFDSLTLGINLVVKKGARLICTNPDVNVDASRNGEHYIIPGGGALVTPFAVASGVDPVIIGKPNPLLFEMALELLGCAAQNCLMIGDRPDTDIAGAAAVGMRTALVRTGRFGPGEVWPESLPQPDFDCESLQQLTLELGLGRHEDQGLGVESHPGEPETGVSR